MRDFGTIVRVLGRVMGDQGHDVPMGDAVATQLVGHETRRFLALPLQEFPKESSRRTRVPAGLDKEVDQVTVLVDRSPQILALTVHRDEDFVQDHVSPSRPCRRFNRRAYSGPNFVHHCRMVSYDTTMPRSARRSSTSRKLRQYLWYNRTA